MTDSTGFDFDFPAFCARVLREYEEVIETIILRPVSNAPGIELATGACAPSPGGTRPSEAG